MTPGSPCLACQESADLRDDAQHLVHARLRRLSATVQQLGGLDFVRVKEQVRIEVRAGAPRAHQMGDEPGHYQIQREGALDAFDRSQLERLDAAAIFQHVEQDLYFPARAVPIDQLGDRQR